MLRQTGLQEVDSGCRTGIQEADSGSHTGLPGVVRIALYSPQPTHKVCKAYDGRLENVAAQGHDLLLKAKEQQIARHRLWLKRKMVDNTPAWRPPKRHRLASKAWLDNLDNQVRVSLGLRGLSDFIPCPDESGRRPNWREWRHLLVSIDQGGDGLCAAAFLRHIGANVSFITDWAHGANNDFLETLRDLSLFQYWLLLLIALNVEHGPHGEDLRHNQIRDAWFELQARSSPQACALFQEYCQEIASEAQGESSWELEAGEDLQDAVWRHLRNEPHFMKKGCRTNLARYQASRRAAEDLLPRWTLKRFIYEYVALETNMLDSSHTARLLIKGEVDLKEGESKQTTDSSRVCISEKALRSACQNALVISCLILEDPTNMQLTKLIVFLSAPVDLWHKQQSRALRSTAGSETWMWQQSSGGFYSHVTGILAQLQDPDVLQRVGLCVPGTSEVDEAQVNSELWLAHLFGAFAMRLASRRIIRCLWFLVGWPMRFVGLLGPEPLRRSTMLQFKADLDAYKALSSIENPPASVRKYLKRSVFLEATVQQFQEVGRFLGQPHSQTALFA